MPDNDLAVDGGLVGKKPALGRDREEAAARSRRSKG